MIIQGAVNHVVDLNWQASASTDVAGYNVYRSVDQSHWSRMNSSLVSSTAYGDATVSNSTTYYYEATAVDIYGNESVPTPTITAVIP